MGRACVGTFKVVLGAGSHCELLKDGEGVFGCGLERGGCWRTERACWAHLSGGGWWGLLEGREGAFERVLERRQVGE
jgi:hypothetical protein